MYEWLTETDKPILPFHHDVGDLKIKRISSVTGLNEMSEVCQLFAAFDVILNEAALFSLSAPDEFALHKIMSEIVPHYVDVKQIFINGKLKQVNVRCLKKESRAYLQMVYTLSCLIYIVQIS